MTADPARTPGDPAPGALSGDVADNSIRARGWTWVPVVVGYWFSYVVGVTAGWSLIAAEAWSWDRFGNIASPAIAGLIGSLGSQALIRKGAFPMRPDAKRKLDRQVETSRAIRTGTLPPDLDREDWRERIRHARRTSGGLLLFVSALSPVAAVLAAVTAHLTSHDAPDVWTVAAIALVPAVPLAWRTRQFHRHTSRLLVQLSRQP